MKNNCSCLADKLGDRIFTGNVSSIVATGWSGWSERGLRLVLLSFCLIIKAAMYRPRARPSCMCRRASFPVPNSLRRVSPSVLHWIHTTHPTTKTQLDDATATTHPVANLEHPARPETSPTAPTASPSSFCLLSPNSSNACLRQVSRCFPFLPHHVIDHDDFCTAFFTPMPCFCSLGCCCPSVCHNQSIKFIPRILDKRTKEFSTIH